MPKFRPMWWVVGSVANGLFTAWVALQYRAVRRQHRRRALELNDTIVQGLAVAELALRLDDRERTEQAISSTLRKARAMITELLGDEIAPGDLRRDDAARV
jgi:hypothetical protein